MANLGFGDFEFGTQSRCEKEFSAIRNFEIPMSRPPAS